MNKKIDLRNLSYEELTRLVVDLGLEPYRSDQISRWVFLPGVRSIDQMTNLSKKWRIRLEEKAYLSELDIERIEDSADGSRKFLFRLEDGEHVESVLIPERGHFTLCISSQVGCAQGCRFCATGSMGLKRNLRTSEILNQVRAVQAGLAEGGVQLTNIVFMGMGEPLHNFKNSLGALETLLSPRGMQFSHRHVTLSTAGLIPEMKALGGRPVNLAVSLNAARDEVRNRLMPINRRHPLGPLLEVCRSYPLPHGKRITFEYLLIQGVNDAPEEARALARLLTGVKAKINLIPFNPHPKSPFRPPEEETIRTFQEVLVQRHYTAIIRRSKGADISAACGQLHATWTG
jgi:23S rRNA (adenine2503-C2)-methyltransferase